MFEKLNQQKNYMQIARQIKHLIQDGTLHIGEKLPSERKLVELFGASRASIREALSAMEMLGLIECRSGQGNYIMADGAEGTIDGELLRNLLQGHDPYEIFEARLVIEPSLTGLAAKRATLEERDRLKGQVASLEALGTRILAGGFPETDTDTFVEEDRRLHLEIGRAAHNEVLFTVFSGVNLMMKETHFTALKKKGLMREGTVKAYSEEHSALLKALLTGDSGAAQRISKAHILSLKKILF